ncbi:hypothetical protein [Flavobacterium sp. '19STA2R22 D10 B1']|uniref:hypothetical protein n=1 Tax=Flavobacterium aerium TaxID=3037261 RepID=UPI00278BC8C7|nr:hypothetical protein [Flavobacterium sp. '19STA2R22 D10 B1']
MKYFILLTTLFLSHLAVAQPKLTLNPKGFDPIDTPINKSPENFIKQTKEWVSGYYRGEADIQDLDSRTILITAFNDDAFFYRNLGETYDYKIKYTLKFTLNDNTYTAIFQVKEIYIENKLIQSKITDYFNSSGKLKEGYQDVKPSLEKTVNSILKSHYNFLVNYR